jgi:short-subunit dehydrogenase
MSLGLCSTVTSNNANSAIIVTGSARASLGTAIIKQIRRTLPSSPIVAIDKCHDESLSADPGVCIVEINLDPFSRRGEYGLLCNELAAGLDRAHRLLNFSGISAVILGAGIYTVGSLIESSARERESQIGVNICGKIETLHAVLLFNESHNVPSNERLTLIDIGSVHGLTSPAKRSLYAATKAFGLSLCTSLANGRELHRAFHIAPGPIETPMLHRNVWVLKAGGPVDFFEFLLQGNVSTYNKIFVECEDGAFTSAARAFNADSTTLAKVFFRYKDIRREQKADTKGVLSVEAVAEFVENLVSIPQSQDGTYILTAPWGVLRSQRLPFLSPVTDGLLNPTPPIR